VADTASTVQGALTAARTLVSKGAVGILDVDAADIQGAVVTYMASQKIPQTYLVQSDQTANDPNIFAIGGVSAPSLPANTAVGSFVKGLGVTKMAGVAWGNIDTSLDLMKSPLEAAATLGVKTVLQDTSTTPTTTDYTPVALAVKSSGAQGDYQVTLAAPMESVATALQQQGVHLKAAIYSNGMYDSSIFATPNESSLVGGYVLYPFTPVEVHNAGTAQYESILRQYAPKVGAGASLLDQFGYLAADLMIQGVDGVSGTVTSASLHTALSSITNYDANGLLTQTSNFTLPKSNPENLLRCYYFIKIQSKSFVPGAKVCGKLVTVK
jgi:hypothetical protein